MTLVRRYDYPARRSGRAAPCRGVFQRLTAHAAHPGARFAVLCLGFVRALVASSLCLCAMASLLIVAILCQAVTCQQCFFCVRNPRWLCN